MVERLLAGLELHQKIDVTVFAGGIVTERTEYPDPAYTPHAQVRGHISGLCGVQLLRAPGNPSAMTIPLGLIETKRTVLTMDPKIAYIWVVS